MAHDDVVQPRTVERIAWNVRYKDPSAFRRVVRKVIELSASAYANVLALRQVPEAPRGRITGTRP